MSEGKGIIFNPLRLVLAWNRFLSIFENCTVKASIINFIVMDPKNFAVAVWPVIGQSFQNTKWPAFLSFQQISQIEQIQLNQTVIYRLRKLKQSWNAL